MKLSRFTLSDNCEEFSAWSGGIVENGWDVPCFTREQVSAFLDTTPYDHVFLDNGYLVIYWDDGEELIPPTPLPTDDLDILEGYFLSGMEWMEVE